MGICTPYKRIASVDKISLERLSDMGIRLILIDRDNTCVSREDGKCPEEIVKWFHRAQQLNMCVCMVSNNFHSDQVQESADELGIAKIDHAMKPCPAALIHACRKFGVPKEQTILIGDQYFTDVAAGNLAGIRTILVKPQSMVDLWYTLLFRKAEAHLFGDCDFDDEL